MGSTLSGQSEIEHVNEDPVRLKEDIDPLPGGEKDTVHNEIHDDVILDSCDDGSKKKDVEDIKDGKSQLNVNELETTRGEKRRKRRKRGRGISHNWEEVSQSVNKAKNFLEGQSNLNKVPVNQYVHTNDLELGRIWIDECCQSDEFLEYLRNNTDQEGNSYEGRNVMYDNMYNFLIDSFKESKIASHVMKGCKRATDHKIVLQAIFRKMHISLIETGMKEKNKEGIIEEIVYFMSSNPLWKHRLPVVVKWMLYTKLEVFSNKKEGVESNTIVPPPPSLSHGPHRRKKRRKKNKFRFCKEHFEIVEKIMDENERFGNGWVNMKILHQEITSKNGISLKAKQMKKKFQKFIELGVYEIRTYKGCMCMKRKGYMKTFKEITRKIRRRRRSGRKRKRKRDLKKQEKQEEEKEKENAKELQSLKFLRLENNNMNSNDLLIKEEEEEDDDDQGGRVEILINFEKDVVDDDEEEEEEEDSGDGYELNEPPTKKRKLD